MDLADDAKKKWNDLTNDNSEQNSGTQNTDQPMPGENVRETNTDQTDEGM